MSRPARTTSRPDARRASHRIAVRERRPCPRCGAQARVSQRGLFLPHYYSMSRLCDGTGMPAPEVT